MEKFVNTTLCGTKYLCIYFSSHCKLFFIPYTEEKKKQFTGERSVQYDVFNTTNMKQTRKQTSANKSFSPDFI